MKEVIRLAKKDAEKEKQKWTSPKGEAKYPFLTKPHCFNDDPIGNYKIDFIVNESEVSDFVERIKAMTDEHYEKTKNEILDKAQTPADKRKAQDKIKELKKQYPFEPEYDDQTGEETGRIILKAKRKAQFKDKKTGELVDSKVSLYDAAAKKITDTTPLAKMGPGSIVKINVFLSPYYVAATGALGVTLRLNAVQIFEMVEWSGGVPEGFEAEEGFTTSESGSEEAGSGNGDF